MYLLGESLDKVRTFQAHVVRLAMENWNVGGPVPNDSSWRDDGRLPAQGSGGKIRSDAQAYERETPAHHEKSLHGTPSLREEDNDAAMGSGLPNANESPPVLVDHRHAGPAKPTQQERRVKLEAGETALKAVTLATKPGSLTAMRVTERKRWRDGVPTIKSRPTAPAKRGGKKPTPPVGVGQHRPAPHQLGTRHANATANTEGHGHHYKGQ